jgi:ParB family transcriptional regulator, chromosome partitioning protein
MTEHPAHLKTLPLSDLYLHPMNARASTTEEEIEALALSIAECGLIQNLSGFEDPARPGFVGIVAGGRRLRALQLLHDRQGSNPDRVEIPVQVTADAAVAENWANAENTARAALHPADEIRAYGRMAKSHAAPETIARAFAVTEAHVRRRLKLADLPDPVLEALKANEITLDIAAAFTLSNSEDASVIVLEDILSPSGNKTVWWVKRQLTGQSVTGTDRRAVFVGADAYVAAGGNLTADLFGSDSVFHDVDLLDRLLLEKLEAELETVKAEGWGWAALTIEKHWSALPAYTGARTADTDIKPDLPAGDQAELDELRNQSPWNLSPEEESRLKELRERAHGDWSDGLRGELGAIVACDPHGWLEIRRGLRLPAKGKKGSTGGTGSSTETPAEPSFSQAVIADLTAIRLHAAQAALLDKPELALDILALRATSYGYYGNFLDVTFGKPTNAPGELEGFTAEDRLTPIDSGTESKTPEDLEALQACGKKARNALITAAIARTLTSGNHALLRAIEEATGANPRAY